MRAQTYTLQNPSTLSQVPEIVHPSKCHPRVVVFSGAQGHSRGRRAQNRIIIGKGIIRVRRCSRTAVASGPSRPEASSTNRTEQRGSFTSSSPRNSVYLDFSPRLGARWGRTPGSLDSLLYLASISWRQKMSPPPTAQPHQSSPLQDPSYSSSICHFDAGREDRARDGTAGGWWER